MAPEVKVLERSPETQPVEGSPWALATFVIQGKRYFCKWVLDPMPERLTLSLSEPFTVTNLVLPTLLNGREPAFELDLLCSGKKQNAHPIPWATLNETSGIMRLYLDHVELPGKFEVVFLPEPDPTTLGVNRHV